MDVSIHATLAGGDPALLPTTVSISQFLSTPPSRVATDTLTVTIACVDVSIHATLAGGDIYMFLNVGDICVSIHATLAGGDAFDY